MKISLGASIFFIPRLIGECLSRLEDCLQLLGTCFHMMHATFFRGALKVVDVGIYLPGVEELR